MIRIPKHTDYVKNADKAGEWHPCIVCGRPIKKPATAAWLRTAYGSDAVTEAERIAIGPAGDTGAFPIGADCLRKHPELQPYVIEAAPGPRAALVRPDADTALHLMFHSIAALDLENGAYLRRSSGRGKGGLGKWSLIVKGPQANVDALVSGFNWQYQTFVRGWSDAEAIELANARLQKWLDKQARAAASV